MDITNSILFFSENKTHTNIENTKLITLNCVEYINPKPLPEILFVTSYPPRECGIATYSQDLINALNNQFENTITNSICSLESETEQHNYVQKPTYILNTDSKNSFIKMVFIINKNDNIKLVVIQHEFGFFAKKEAEFTYFVENITKPIVFVLHTVIPNPSKEFKLKIQLLLSAVSSIIVMTMNAAEILMLEYDIAVYKIKIIPHGSHLVPPLDRTKLKQHYQLLNRKVLSTFGLIGSSKSIETTLYALPKVIQKYPEVLFLVLGKTHPTILKNEGETYREMLKEIVVKLNLENNVRFVNEYLKLPVLLEYLQLSDIYLFTSKDPNQAVSGTFSYAVSCGCPIISTPIPHAKEVLNKNNGIIFKFENSEELSNAIISLLDNDKLREEISSNSFQKMTSTAWQNAAIAHMLLFASLIPDGLKINYKIPPINLAHIKKMTTQYGIIQFAKFSIPNIKSGYTLDDNARALIAICQHYEMYQNEQDFKLINTYLEFIKFCFQANGQILNYVNEQSQFTNQNFDENIEDSRGRTIWALGYVSSLHHILPINITNEADNLLEKSLQNIDKIYSTRAIAFIIKGLYYQNKNTKILQLFANRLYKMYQHEKTVEWHWYESYLTYGNSLLPEAMLCAFLSTNILKYKTVAKESFDFLLSKIFVHNKIKVISNKGWHFKDKIKEHVVGGEQPIDVAYTILALERFYIEYKKIDFKLKAITAFNWFLGDNHLNQIVYNPCTGGCYDGVEEFNVNLNQGAESTISYLLAKLAIERMNQL